jgi:thymidine kinase
MSDQRHVRYASICCTLWRLANYAVLAFLGTKPFTTYSILTSGADPLAVRGSARHIWHMAKLYFHFSTMNAGKSTLLLQAAHNYRERGMECYLMTARLDHRAGHGRIGSRIGIGSDADTYEPGDDLFAKIAERLEQGPVACVFIDESQFLERDQVWQLARVVDDLGVPVMCYGLRVDFQGELGPGSAALLALADEMREVRTICHCGKKATMVVRLDDVGIVRYEGAQVQVVGNESYFSLCLRHWRDALAGT